MTSSFWGLLGTETIPSLRRTRTLELGSSVRSFNELAVPGVGGIWYGKQLLFALIGIIIAEESNGKIRNIEAANAVEALACWLALSSNKWTRDTRIRGLTKLRGKTDLSFGRSRKQNFYVTQPMRMRTVQALPALGLVEASSIRFNSFVTTPEGLDFVESFRSKNNFMDNLINWSQGHGSRVTSNKNLIRTLSPLESMSKHSAEILRERLLQGNRLETADGRERRRNALAWVSEVGNSPNASLDWSKKPEQLAADHWDDLKAGGLFFLARNSAISVLQAIEGQIATLANPRLDIDFPVVDSIKTKIKTLRGNTENFLQFKRHNTDEQANQFCRECSNQHDDRTLLANLVQRDGRVLRLDNNYIIPGPAFRKSSSYEEKGDTLFDEDNELLTQRNSIEWPDGISSRIQNFFLLNLDMRGELSSWLEKPLAPKNGNGQ